MVTKCAPSFKWRRQSPSQRSIRVVVGKSVWDGVDRQHCFGGDTTLSHLDSSFIRWFRESNAKVVLLKGKYDPVNLPAKIFQKLPFVKSSLPPSHTNHLQLALRTYLQAASSGKRLPLTGSSDSSLGPFLIPCYLPQLIISSFGSPPNTINHSACTFCFFFNLLAKV